MSEIIGQSEERKTLYYALGFTLVFVLYISLVQVPFSSCFRLDVGSNSLGLAIYNAEMVQGFFQARDQAQSEPGPLPEKNLEPSLPVSYTHLTLPTIYSV